MQLHENDQLLMADSDHAELVRYINTHRTAIIGKAGMAGLVQDIENAVVVPASEFPWDHIRLHSKVIIRDKIARVNYTYTLVMPEFNDHRKCKVSVFSSIGKALLGSKRGSDIVWELPGKKRYFTVMAITQLSESQEV